MSVDQVLARIESLSAHEWVMTGLYALFLLVVTAIITKVAVHFIRLWLNKDNNPLPSSSIIINIVRVVIWGLCICTILDTCFGINASAFIAALGVGGIALSLGFQDTLANLIGGLQVTFMGIVKPGDYIEVGSSVGVVRDVNWRHTSIDNSAGEHVIIPNSIISKTALVHLTKPGAISVTFSLNSHMSDLDAAACRLQQAASNALEQIAEVSSPVVVRFTSMTDLAILGTVSATLVDIDKKSVATDAIVRAIAREARLLVDDHGTEA